MDSSLNPTSPNHRTSLADDLIYPQTQKSIRKSASAKRIRPKSAGPRPKRKTDSFGYRSKGKSKYQVLKELEDGWVGLGNPSVQTFSAAGSGMKAQRALSSSRRKVSKSASSSSFCSRRPNKTKLNRIKRDASSNSVRGRGLPVKKGRNARSKSPVSRKMQAKRKKRLKQLVYLWEEMRVPQRDRSFFYNNYCVPQSGKLKQKEADARVRAQLELLRAHRRCTLIVLRYIENREEKLARLKQVIMQDNTSIDTDALEEIIPHLREASLLVIEAIQDWRRLLWRPHPFRFRDVNYLLKMESDAYCYKEYVDATCQDIITFSDANPRPEESKVERCRVAQEAVLSEKALQQEVQEEHQRLIQSGFYIPMLRWSPQDEVHFSNEKRTEPPDIRESVTE